MNRRFLFVRLPYFPMERHIKAHRKTSNQTKPWWDQEEWDKTVWGQDKSGKKDAQAKSPETDTPAPLVLVQHGAKGTRISAVGPDAQALGLWPDMKLADARSMVPELQVATHDTNSDHHTQARLARWLVRYSPSVAINGNDGFLLETTGCDHLFAGEATMADDIKSRLSRMGFSLRLAFADTVGAAIALVNGGAKRIDILPPNNDPAMLDALSVEALRLDAESLVLLKRLGLKRIGDVRPIPRPALERRFRNSKGAKKSARPADMAQSVQWRLDQLSGAVAEPLHTVDEPQFFRSLLQCIDMALESEAVGIALDRLLPDLCDQLTEAGCGGRCFQLTAYRADGGLSQCAVRVSQPCHAPHQIRRLFRDRLDQIDCGYGIDLFILAALNVEAVAQGQNDMIDAHRAELTSASLAAFSDTIANRMNRPAVAKPMPRASHVPERAQRLMSVSRFVDWKEWQAMQPVWSPRPLRLFERPEPADVTAELPDSPPAQFIWRRVLRRVVRSRGPERILPEWWHDALKSKPSAAFRDYYDVEDTNGLRYWIFRSIKHVPVQAGDDEILWVSNDNKSGDGAEETTTLETPEPIFVTTISWYVHGLF